MVDTIVKESIDSYVEFEIFSILDTKEFGELGWTIENFKEELSRPTSGALIAEIQV